MVSDPEKKAIFQGGQKLKVRVYLGTFSSLLAIMLYDTLDWALTGVWLSAHHYPISLCYL